MDNDDNNIAKEVKEVWDHYRQYHPHTAERLHPGSSEYAIAVRRLDAFSPWEFKRSIDGWHKWMFFLGYKPHELVMLSFPLIAATTVQVEMGFDLLEKFHNHSQGLLEHMIGTITGVQTGIEMNEMAKARGVKTRKKKAYSLDGFGRRKYLQ